MNHNGEVHDPKGLRVLLAEDELLLANALADDLNLVGFSIIGPFTSLGAAMEASRCEPFDLAILDIDLNGELVYPLADDLERRGIPFMFVTSCGSAEIPERFRTSPRVAKPHDEETPMREIRRIAVRGSRE
jgi:DNA-binding NarL/FixJ family response regulator